jgi:hypothetical protein
MSTRFALEFLGIWEEMYNPNFNRMEFHTIKNAEGRLVLWCSHYANALTDKQ